MTADREQFKSLAGELRRNRIQQMMLAKWQDPKYRAARRASHRAAEARVQAGEGVLYLARVVGTDIVKIGHTLDFAKRAKAIKADFGATIELMASIPANRATERWLHPLLGKYRRRDAVRKSAGEFYHISVLEHPAIPAELKVSA